MLPHGRILLVDDARPEYGCLTGYDGVCVKVMDAGREMMPDVIDIMELGTRWHDASDGLPVGVYARIGARDRGEIGSIIKQRAPWAAYVLLQIDPALTSDLQAENLRDVVHGIRLALPGIAVGYWLADARPADPVAGSMGSHLAVLCDFGVLAVADGSGIAMLAHVQQSPWTRYLQVDPENQPAWLDTAQLALRFTGALFVWRAGMADAVAWGMQLPGVTQLAAQRVWSDPLRPVEWGPSGWEARFVAWDGERWWLTDGLWRTGLDEAAAMRWMSRGLVVRSWPECVNETTRVPAG